VAITRAQIPEQVDIFAEGGASESDSDSYTDLYNRLSQTDFDVDYDKYMQRLSQFAPEQPKMSIFEVASQLGRGLLSTPNTGVGSTYQGLGVGFDNISTRLKADREMNEKRRREVAMMASQMAMQDEQKANDFLNDIALQRISAANKKVDYITLEYQEGGEIKSIRLPDTNQYADQINNIIQNKGGREVKPATTQINMPGGSTKADEKALNQMYKDQETFGEKAEASNSTLDQVNQARLLAEEVGRINFGPLAKGTLQAREFISGIGLGDWLQSEEKIAPQKALNQLSMSFTMGIVSQTKGAISDREMKLFIQASPTLGSTYDGYMKQLELLERLAARDSQFYIEYLDKAMELQDTMPNEYQKQQLELEKFGATWKRNNPLFTREETKSLQDMVEGGDGGYEGAGLAEDFDRDAWEDKMNGIKEDQAKKRVSGVAGVPDGSTLIGEVDGAKFYLKPGGNVNNKEDIIKVQ
tara:strand:+ start:184 stop:1593 length:1410 start_codon:yes stop_codon:yes gene_type:complete